MRLLSCGAVAGLALLIGADSALAQVASPEAELSIEADEVVYEDERELYEADGSVRMQRSDGRSLTADWIAFSARTRVGIAVGNVVLRDGDDVVRADFATIDLDTLTAMATQASLGAASEGFLITGRNVQRTGDRTYRIEGGVFTTCRCPPDHRRRPWEIGVSQAAIEVEGYAVARNVVFRVLDVPVLYTPWLILPVKTRRQTGFLLPHVSSSGRNGIEVELPFFWAPRADLNLLLKPRSVSKRGARGALELDYVFGEAGWTRGGFSALPNDREVDRRDPKTPFADDRWAYWLRHEQPLGPGARFGLDLMAASDNSYVVDFHDLGEEKRTGRFLESMSWLSFAGRGLYGGVEASLIDDLQSPNDLDRDDSVLHRLPDVRLSSLPRRLGPLPILAGLDVRYTYYYQQDSRSRLRGRSPVRGQFFDTGTDGVFNEDEPDAAGRFLNDPNVDSHLDDVPAGGFEGDGVFQEGELLADRGHRVDLHPRLVLPWRFGVLESLSELGYRHTFYSADRAGVEAREMWTGRIDVRSRFARDFEVASVRLRHVVEPKLGFTLLAGPEQGRNPLFVPASGIRQRRLIDGDPRVVTRNPSDRIGDERLLHFAIENLVYRARPADAGLPDRILSLRLGTGYDLLEGRMTDVFVEGRMAPRDDLNVHASIGYDTKKTRIDEVRAGLGWASGTVYGPETGGERRRHRLDLGYRFLRDRSRFFEAFRRQDEVFDAFDPDLTRIDQLSFSARFAAARQLDVVASGYFSFDDGSTRGGHIGLTFLSDCGCWDFTGTLERRSRPDDTRLVFQLRLAGLGFSR